MVVNTVEEAADVIGRVADEMCALNDQQLIGSDCITVDPTQVSTWR